MVQDGHKGKNGNFFFLQRMRPSAEASKQILLQAQARSLY